MNEFDHFDLDGHALRLFLAVLEEGSVTAAADRLGLTQSAVSHALQKIRGIVRDPLFVKSGRGIAPTAHANALAQDARRLLADLKEFTRGASFDPRTTALFLTVAANDLQRDVLLPEFLHALKREFASVRLRIVPSDQPTPEMLREDRCDLVISPFPPSGVDILQKRLFDDEYVCFHDPQGREAPSSAEDYLAAEHVTVVYTSRVGLGFDTAMEAAGHHRRFSVEVVNFAGVPAFLRGSRRLASLPRGLAAGVMRNFVVTPLPVRVREASFSMYLSWHRRNSDDPTHALVRKLLLREATRAASGPYLSRNASEPTFDKGESR